MVSGNKPGVRSRSSSPDPKSTNSDFSAAPAKYTGKKRTLADCFRSKSKPPAPERSDDTIVESECSELPTTSIDYMRENLQSLIDSSMCDGPCPQNAPVPSPVYQDPQCGCDGTDESLRKSPVPARSPRKTPSPVRASQVAPPPLSKTGGRNKSPASCFRTKPKKPSLKSEQAATQPNTSEPPKRSTRGVAKRATVEQSVCGGSTEESVSLETPSKSLECMREKLQSIIDNSMCDGPCYESVTAPSPIYREAQCGCENTRRVTLAGAETSSCNRNHYSYAATHEEGFSRVSTRCVCNSTTFPVAHTENYSARGTSSCICNPSACPVAPMENYSARGTSSCICNPSACPVTPMESHSVRGGLIHEQGFPIRGPSSCICDPTACPISPGINSGCDTNMKVFPPAPTGTCCDCNLPTSTQPDEECPCDCEPGPESTCVAKRSAFERLRGMFGRILRPGNASCQNQIQNPYYTFRQDNATPLPRRLVFNLVDGIPSYPQPPPPPPPPRRMVRKEEKIERIVTNSSQKNSYNRYTNKVDIYYFDHGNSGYYRTTDNPPPLITDEFLEKSDRYATEFWANIFGVCHVGISYVTIFFLQLFRFICYSFIRSPIVGFIQILSDYIVKPILSIFFNGIVQTIFIFFFNIATSFRDLCEPLAHSIGFLLREIAQVLRAIRLVEQNNVHPRSQEQPRRVERCKQSPCGPCAPCRVT